MKIRYFQKKFRSGCVQRSGTDPRTITNEDAPRFPSTWTICSVSTKLATSPRASEPRQWCLMPTRAMEVLASIVIETSVPRCAALAVAKLPYISGVSSDSTVDVPPTSAAAVATSAATSAAATSVLPAWRFQQKLLSAERHIVEPPRAPRSLAAAVSRLFLSARLSGEGASLCAEVVAAPSPSRSQSRRSAVPGASVCWRWRWQLRVMS
mmetsp:Transcript_17328/g.42788  ORF Transcript_17328/g.42788 Transcript_17328/m.42788 type:complete len:209 (-) Transcript_17328:627-1253(-)